MTGGTMPGPDGRRHTAQGGFTPTGTERRWKWSLSGGMGGFLLITPMESSSGSSAAAVTPRQYRVEHGAEQEMKGEKREKYPLKSAEKRKNPSRKEEEKVKFFGESRDATIGF